MVWLLLCGALFRKIVEIPGFGAASYIDFLTPGIVVMTCLFSAGWSGMDLIEDIDRGVATWGPWSLVVLGRIGWLLVFALVCGWLATAAFRVYQKSI